MFVNILWYIRIIKFYTIFGKFEKFLWKIMQKTNNDENNDDEKFSSFKWFFFQMFQSTPISLDCSYFLYKSRLVYVRLTITVVSSGLSIALLLTWDSNLTKAPLPKTELVAGESLFLQPIVIIVFWQIYYLSWL